MSADIVSKAVVAQFITEVFENRSGEHLPLLLTSDFRAHAWSYPGRPGGIPQLRQIIDVLQESYRDPRITVQDLIAEGDRVVARYHWEAERIEPAKGGAAGGKRIGIPGVLIARMRGQQIAECWWEDRPAAIRRTRAT